MADSLSVTFRPVFLEDLGTSTTLSQTTATVMGLGPGIPVTPIVAAASDAAAITTGLNAGDIYLNNGETPNRLRATPASTQTTWVPNVTGGGSMVVSSITVNFASYAVIGPLCFLNFSIEFLTSGTQSNVVIITVPFPSVNSSVYVPVTGWGTTGLTTYIPLTANIGTKLQVYAGGSDNQNYAVGAHILSGTFGYRIA